MVNYHYNNIFKVKQFKEHNQTFQIFISSLITQFIAIIQTKIMPEM